MSQILYKYRPLKNFKYLVDILINGRLHASRYTDLNDPMEGHYCYRGNRLDASMRDKLRGEKEELRICSLSEDADNVLLWSHYADGHRGVAIGVELAEGYRADVVRYCGLPEICTDELAFWSARKILTCMVEAWAYEKERRVFVKGKCYVPVKVREIIAGREMRSSDYELIRKLAGLVDSSIVVRKAGEERG